MAFHFSWQLSECSRQVSELIGWVWLMHSWFAPTENVSKSSLLLIWAIVYCWSLKSINQFTRTTNIIFCKKTYVHIEHWTLGGFPNIMSHFVPIPRPCPAHPPNKIRNTTLLLIPLPLPNFPIQKKTKMQSFIIKSNLQKWFLMTQSWQPDWIMIIAEDGDGKAWWC